MTSSQIPKEIKERLKLASKLSGTFRFGECIVMVGLESGWHLSISHPKRLPTYDEVKEARYKFLPDNAHMAMIFPPKSEFVNVCETCFHLWEI